MNCQNWQILKAHVSEDGKVDMPLLNDVQARELFMFHSFARASYVLEGFEEVLNKVVVACEELPNLSLEVLSNFLKNKHTTQIWEETLKRLRETSLIFNMNKDHIYSWLQIHYDNLAKKEIYMFLERAFFLATIFLLKKV
jgi:hypothetical protein